MSLPNDLKHYEAPRPGFNLFTPEEAGALLCVVIFGAVALDLLRSLLAWMFS